MVEAFWFLAVLTFVSDVTLAKDEDDGVLEDEAVTVSNAVLSNDTESNTQVEDDVFEKEIVFSEDLENGIASQDVLDNDTLHNGTDFKLENDTSVENTINSRPAMLDPLFAIVLDLAKQPPQSDTDFPSENEIEEDIFGDEEEESNTIQTINENMVKLKPPQSVSWSGNSSYNAGEDKNVYNSSYEADSLEEAMAQFGQRLYSHLAKMNPRKNLVFSPLSLHSAMTMVYLGATPGSETFAELTNNVAPNINDTNEFLADYDVVSTFYRNQTTFKYGNKIWVAKGFEIEENYKEVVYKNLDTVTEYADFAVEETKERINNWVSKKTGGQIEQLVDSFSPDTKLFIANALHFKEAWDLPFDKADLRGNDLGQEDFFVVNNEGVFEKFEVPMMFQLSSDLYTYGIINTPKGSSVEVVSIPYRNNNFEMQLLIPSDNSAEAFDKLEEEMEDVDLFNIFSYPKNINEHLLVEDISIKMPMFKIEESLDAAQIFQQMGIKKAFTDGSLDNLSKNPLVVDRIVHKAKVEVNPVGTEGGAATGIQLVPLSASFGVNIDFVLNRPFIFILQDIKNNIPILVGRVVDPRDQGNTMDHFNGEKLRRDFVPNFG